MNEHDKLSQKAISLLLNEDNDLYVSLASLWEIAIKVSLGKLALRVGGVGVFTSLIEIMPIELLPISSSYIVVVERLPFIHRDPFDRLLIATAMTEGMTIVTVDENMSKYDVATIW